MTSTQRSQNKHLLLNNRLKHVTSSHAPTVPEQQQSFFIRSQPKTVESEEDSERMNTGPLASLTYLERNQDTYNSLGHGSSFIGGSELNKSILNKSPALNMSKQSKISLNRKKLNEIFFDFKAHSIQVKELPII